MTVLNKEITKDIRRGILWVLKAVGGKKINDKILQASLREGGHDLRLAEVRDHIKYLSQKDKCFIFSWYNEAADMYICEITGRGRDVIDGMIYDPGVSDGDGPNGAA